ncbi:Pumilio [Dirofilaria immitis]
MTWRSRSAIILLVDTLAESKSDDMEKSQCYNYYSLTLAASKSDAMETSQCLCSLIDYLLQTNSPKNMLEKRNRRSCISANSASPSYRNQRIYPNLEQLKKNHLNGDGSDDNISYESDHAEFTDSQRSASNSPISQRSGNNSLMLTLLEWIQNPLDDLFSLVKYLCIILVIFIFCGLIYSSSNSNSEVTSLKRYKKQINGVLKKNFTTEYQHGINTKAVLRLIGEKWVFQKSVEPYVVLITGTKADMLANALGDVFSNVTGKGEIDRIFCNEYKERQLLETEVTKSLSKYSKSVILHGIDKLRGRAPLYLHSLSDPDHSPFPSALILLTINLFFGSHPSCEDAISSHLLNEWDSDYIGEDQIRPILSRISSFLICLEE